ncbi:DHA2 family multidrug resistance protein-like MFS transporter [Haloactinospora alba]|uniref:DHA2 family multidrug resistance protein-like MFS transporter n=1 Tax=Haloactinospora alba TaxID=405555 RepID=A0A543NND4_9ACTN|nr:MFS transporter [Haloactinospora alba]TQN33342.1 DHA2 family multidrug resistance protein-like MFS transporter [Haloactinospora alba]
MTSDTAQRATWRAWLGLAILTLPLLMAATDMTVLFLALPSIAADLTPGSTQLLWILHAGEFLTVGFALTMGRVAQRIGPRRLLVIGGSAYGLASLAAAHSPTPEILIAMRGLLGVAAATLLPSVMALLRGMFPVARQFSVAVAVTMSSFSAGMALGPPLGGFLLENFWWGSVFLVNVPVAALLLAGAPLLPSPRGDGAGRVDITSVLLSLGAIISVIFGLQEIADKQTSATGEPLWPYLLAVVVGLGFLVAFVRRQLRLADPLLDLRTFAAPAFTISLLAMLLMLLGMGGTDMLLAQYLQTVIGLSPGRAGLLLLAPALASAVGGMLAPVLNRWTRPAFTMAGGLLTAAGGAAVMVLLEGRAGAVALVAVAAVIALALGPLFTLSTNLVVGTAPKHQAGSAAALGDVSGGFGNALSLAFLGSLSAVVYRSALEGSVPAEASESAAEAARESIGGATAVAGNLPGEAGAELLEAARSAFGLGLQSAYGFGAVLLTLVAVLVAWLLRHASIDTADGEESPTEAVPDETAREPV